MWSHRAPLSLVALLSLTAPSAYAQQSARLDRFAPAARASEGFGVDRAEGQGHLRVGAVLAMDYANDPLVWAPHDGGEELSIVEHHLVGHVTLSLGLADAALIYAGLPVTLVMDGQDDEVRAVGQGVADGAGVGDALLGFRLLVLGGASEAVSLAGQATVTFPTAEASAGGQRYTGDEGVTGHPELLLTIRGGPLTIAASVGARLRRESRVQNVNVGHELTYGLGVAVRLIDELLEAHVELSGSLSTEDFAEEATSPLELLAGVKLTHGSGVTLGAAAGPGLARGFGSPDVRVVGLVGYEQPAREEVVEPPPPPPPPAPSDRDGDGLLDDDDGCPSRPEDADGFQDEDGCPDDDNDGDGVLDADDGAPDAPEDPDGFEDEDGVPDPDNDDDGVFDAQDACPRVAGPVINRGCPEPDRDGDGVVDRRDNCPDEPGAVEHEGCRDAQLVRIVDTRLEILERVHFRTGRATLERRSFALLDDVARVIVNHPELGVVRVEGHTDARGDRDGNLRLSQRRAEAVVRYLTRRGDVPADRLEAVGHGPDRPVVADARSEEDHARNRRVELHTER